MDLGLRDKVVVVTGGTAGIGRSCVDAFLEEGSRVVVTGDDTQVDLPSGVESGLSVAVGVLKDVDEIAIVRFQESDVVRHELIRKIVGAYAAAHK